ncbi:hypothetical protein AZA_37968 [Nitrospirillum viridazoti Y2]|nr:hypothetical protein AZA_37968 [Nitrospirillum amazonense Y2]
MRVPFFVPQGRRPRFRVPASDDHYTGPMLPPCPHCDDRTPLNSKRSARKQESRRAFRDAPPAGMPQIRNTRQARHGAKLARCRRSAKCPPVKGGNYCAKSRDWAYVLGRLPKGEGG